MSVCLHVNFKTKSFDKIVLTGSPGRPTRPSNPGRPVGPGGPFKFHQSDHHQKVGEKERKRERRQKEIRSEISSFRFSLHSCIDIRKEKELTCRTCWSRTSRLAL